MLVASITSRIRRAAGRFAGASVLSYCASGSQNFYLLYSASQVVTAFNSIGTSLPKLRVAR
jgi:hypothetical protein